MVTNRDIVEIHVNGNRLSRPDDVADGFCAYFVDAVAEMLRGSFGSGIGACTLDCFNNSSMYFRPISVDEVVRSICGIKNVSSTGLDGVGVRAVKAVADVIAVQLCEIFNHSIKQAVFPNQLKSLKIIPVFKKGSKSDITNYRPIAIASVFSKVFESIVNQRILHVLDTFTVLSNCQHGFRKRLSTETATIKYFEYIYSNLDKGRYVVGIFFDMSRAFDSLLPEFVCSKLHALGIRGMVLEWVRSFLTERTLRVLFGGSMSRDAPVEMGVPQGSILGPLIFLLFINDLPNHLLDAHVVMYADDTSIAVADCDPERVALRVRTVRRQFEEWCRKNRIVANSSKTVYVNFYIRRPLPETALRNTDFKDSCTFLGVTVDPRLSFVEHIDLLCKKLNSSYFAILKLKACLPLDDLIEAYNALCYSHISYNILIWGRVPQWTRVFILQKRIFIFSLECRVSCRPVFASNNFLTLPAIYILKAATYVRDNLDKYRKLEHGYSTRHPEYLVTDSHASTFFERSPQFDFVRIYNKLPSSIKSVKSGSAFKNLVKELLLTRTYYSYQDYLGDSF